MNDLLITKVERFGGDSEDASVTLSSGIAEVVAFCFPCEWKAGATVPNLLRVLDAERLQSPFFHDWPEDERERASREVLNRTGEFSYSGCGRVIDPAEGLVGVCGFVFDFGDVPAGAEFVEFAVTRLDLR